MTQLTAPRDKTSDVWASTVMAESFLRNMELVLLRSNGSRWPTSNWDCKCPVDDLLTLEGPKLHPEIMLMLPFSEHAYYKEACNSDTPAQNTNYFNFFLPPVIFPHSSDHFTSLPHKYPEALLPLGRWTWNLFSWLLAWLPCEQILSLLQTSPSRFDLLHVRQMKLVWQQFLGYDIKSTGNKRKSRQIGIHQNLKHRCIKRHHKQSKKTTHEMGGNLCKSYI